MDARRRHIAENEVRFRDINERLEADLRRLPVDGEPVEFVCECGYLECAQSVRLTLDEYEEVRKDPTTFALIPGHEILDAEDVVVANERYVVARKKPPTRPLVEATDPRAPII